MTPAASAGGIVSRHDADNICLVQQEKGEKQAADCDESEAVSVGLESVLQATRWRTMRLTVANQKVLVYNWYHGSHSTLLSNWTHRSDIKLIRCKSLLSKACD